MGAIGKLGSRKWVIATTCVALLGAGYLAMPVGAATTVIHPSADSFILEKNPNQNRGTRPFIRYESSASNGRIGYLQFTVPNLSGAVQSASIHPYITDKGAFNVYTTATFNEKTITAKNAPDIGTLIATVDAKAKGSTMIDVTKAFASSPSGKTIAFAIMAKGEAGAFASRENKLNKPADLVLGMTSGSTVTTSKSTTSTTKAANPITTTTQGSTNTTVKNTTTTVGTPGSQGVYGPNGKHWPTDTPAYDTPATKKVNSLADLNGALASAQSGDVIEVASQNYGSEVVIRNGNASWAKNVLVRAPLGKIQSVYTPSLKLEAPNVTVAGFRVGNLEAHAGANSSNFARIVTTAQAYVEASGNQASLNNFGFYEVISEGVMNDNRDRFDIWAYGPNGAVNNLVISGSWFDSTYIQPDSAAHADVLQTFTNDGSIGAVTVIDTYLGAGANASFQNGDLWNGTGMQTVINTYMRGCGMADGVAPGFTCNGFYTYNGGQGRSVLKDNVLVGGSVIVRTNTSSLTPKYGFTFTNNKMSDFAIGVGPQGTVNTYDRSTSPNYYGSGNVVDSKLSVAPPARPNLNSIWN